MAKNHFSYILALLSYKQNFCTSYMIKLPLFLLFGMLCFASDPLVIKYGRFRTAKLKLL